MKLSPFSLSVMIAGGFIGAGFMSGHELWQFFGRFGAWGIVGFILAITCIIALSYMTIDYAVKTHSNTFEKIINPKRNAILKNFLLVYQTVFCICLYIIMTAGVEALVSEYFNVSPLIVGTIFCVIVTVVSLLGVNGIVTVFSTTIPILIVTVFIIAVFILTSGQFEIRFDVDNSSSLLSNWFVSTFVFISYNYFAGLGIFAALENRIKGKKTLVISSVLAALFLLVLGLSILISVFATQTFDSEMPMSSVSKSIGAFWGYTYSALLVTAMLGAGISSLFPLTEWFKVSFPQRRILRIILAFLISAIAVLLSLFGFSTLVGTIYPIFGYAGFLIIGIIIFNCIKHK